MTTRDVSARPAAGWARVPSARAQRWRRRGEAFAFTAPAWLLLIVIVAIPIVIVFYVSFTSSSLTSVMPTK